MCFSVEASFISSGFLVVTGIISLSLICFLLFVFGLDINWDGLWTISVDH
jgi:hypothetical protein